jgi:replication-associated recombination protein RarA
MLPSSYKPKTPDQFIGSARRAAGRLDKLIAASSTDGAPIKVLLLGKPGIGKSALAEYCCSKIGCDRFNTTLLNGTQVKIEEVEAIARSLHYKELFGSYRVLRFEEVDKMSNVAQVRMLTLLDELPPYSAVIATSNCALTELEERFQSRFLVLELQPPPDSEIGDLLLKLAPALPEPSIRQVMTFACGNVRRALLDADKVMLQLPTPLSLAA